NDVVIVHLAEIDPFFTEIGGVDVEARGFEHQLDRLRSGAIVFDQQYAHASPASSPRRLKVGTTAVSLKNALELNDFRPSYRWTVNKTLPAAGWETERPRTREWRG